MKDVTFNIVYMAVSLVRVPLVMLCFLSHCTAALSGYAAGRVGELPKFFQKKVD